MIMRAASVLTLAALVMGISGNDVQAGRFQLKKKVGIATFEFDNLTAFGVTVELKSGAEVVYETVLERLQYDDTEQTVGAGTPFFLCVTPEFGQPLRAQIEEPAIDDCVHIDIYSDPETGALSIEAGEFECILEDGDDHFLGGGGGFVNVSSLRESIALAGSTSGLLLLAFAGSLFGRARLPEEDLPTAE